MRTHVSLSNSPSPNAGFQFIKLNQFKLEMIIILKVFTAALPFRLSKVNERGVLKTTPKIYVAKYMEISVKPI